MLLVLVVKGYPSARHLTTATEAGGRKCESLQIISVSCHVKVDCNCEHFPDGPDLIL